MFEEGQSAVIKDGKILQIPPNGLCLVAEFESPGHHYQVCTMMGDRIRVTDNWENPTEMKLSKFIEFINLIGAEYEGISAMRISS